jgi:predicted secreted protein
MMKTLSLFVLVLLVAGVLWAQSPGGGDVLLGADDKGRTVSANEGQTFTIRLDGNATTGFQWEVAGVEGKSVSQVGVVEYQKAGPGIHAIGQAGTFTAKFRAVAAGRSVINMVYRRPHEKDAPPVDSFSVTIDVGQAAKRPATTQSGR